MSAGYVPVLERDARVIRGAVACFTGAAARVDGIGASRLEVVVDTGRREFYSYGRHFPLARFIPRNANGRRRPALWIINGDVWTGNNGWHVSRTFDHQRVTREAIRASGIASIVLPFSALSGAGIDFDTVRPVHVRPDAEWTETRYADVLSDVPRWERTVGYDVARESTRWTDIPGAVPVPRTGRRYRYRPDYAHTYRERTVDELEAYAREHDYASVADMPDYLRRASLPILPDADGRYRWTERRTKDRPRDADGRYSWSVHVHRLGDSLFSAVRVDADGRRHHGRFLSSFDTNEVPPLYFLAQVPRGAGDTVESATDSLAPRAVHAAYARGRRVYRQGDIFFVESNLTREALEQAGARFARLTLWTRDARPRPDEVTGRRRLSAKDRRARDAREARLRRRLWREYWRELEARRGARIDANTVRRLEARERWDDMRRRHTIARAAAIAAGVALEAPESVRCDTCLAPIGARCIRLEPSDLVPESLARRINVSLERYGSHEARIPLGRLQAREVEGLRRELGEARVRTLETVSARPVSPKGIRRRQARDIARALERLESARVKLRRATFGEAPASYRSARRARVDAIAYARADYDRALENLEYARLIRARERDAYRNAGVSGYRAAYAIHRRASDAAALKVRPDEVRFDTEVYRRRCEIIRGAVRIYGTAHTATELAHVNGAVYARGRVRHMPELENGAGRWRDPRPDHRSFTLGAGETWYLALRNRVPRQ